MHNRYIIKSDNQLQTQELFIVPVNAHLKNKINCVLIKILIVYKVYYAKSFLRLEGYHRDLFPSGEV